MEENINPVISREEVLVKIQAMMDTTTYVSEEILHICKELSLTNEQFFISWQDKLNKISVE